MMQDGVIEVSDIRPEVIAFAKAMEQELRNNDYKGGWKECSSEYLWIRVNSELGELANLHIQGTTKRPEYLSEAADVANFLMMMCDVKGYLVE